MVDHRDDLNLGMLAQRQPQLLGIGTALPVQLELRGAEPVGPDDRGHPLAVYAIVDDQRALSGRNRRQQRRLHRRRARPGQNHRHVVLLRSGHEGLEELPPDALEQLRTLGLTVTDVGPHERLAHAVGNVHRSRIQQDQRTAPRSSVRSCVL